MTRTTERMWTLGRYVASHGHRWTIEDGKLMVETCYATGEAVWSEIYPSFRSVRQWLGY